MTSDEQPEIVLGSGPDGRIVAEFLARKKQLAWEPDGIPGILLSLSRKHGRSVQDLKALCRSYQRQKNLAYTPVPAHEAAMARYQDRACYCGETDGIEWRSNPYSAEIHGNYSKRWMCPSCVHESAMDI